MEATAGLCYSNLLEEQRQYFVIVITTDDRAFVELQYKYTGDGKNEEKTVENTHRGVDDSNIDNGTLCMLALR